LNGIGTALFFEPILVERVWGGNRLGELFGAQKSAAGKVIGESWELSDRPEAASRIIGGKWSGKTLSALRQTHPGEIFGEVRFDSRNPAPFPILVKFVDAGQPLSVQVHPDDRQARTHGDRGKAECWVIVRARPGAKLIRGLKSGVTREVFETALKENRVADVLRSFPVQVGDVVSLPPGVVHAIGEGVVLAEFQQNSDLTYRVWDYGRLGLDGRPRALHVQDALSVIRFDDPGDEFDGDQRADLVVTRVVAEAAGLREELLLTGKFFVLWRVTLQAGARWSVERTGIVGKESAPLILTALSGAAQLTSGKEPACCWSAGQTILLPADAFDWSVTNATAEPFVALAARPLAV
jgi:mannose-6-phosphate isomerase